MSLLVKEATVLHFVYNCTVALQGLSYNKIGSCFTEASFTRPWGFASAGFSTGVLLLPVTLGEESLLSILLTL